MALTNVPVGLPGAGCTTMPAAYATLSPQMNFYSPNKRVLQRRELPSTTALLNGGQDDTVLYCVCCILNPAMK